MRRGVVAAQIVTVVVLVAAMLVLAACGTDRTAEVRRACASHGGVVAIDDDIVACKDGTVIGGIGGDE